MRTRRRPALQDKTPGNTPQKPKPKTTRKPKLVPVVEITTRPPRAAKSKNVKPAVEEPMEIDAGEEHESPKSELEHIECALGTRFERGGSAEARIAQEATPISPTPRTTRRGAVAKAPQAVRAKRGRPRKAQAHDEAEEVQVAEPPADGLHVEQPQALRMLPSPESPSAAHQPKRLPLGSIPRTPFPIVQPERYSTPDSIPVADDDSTASEAVRAILATPSPARIIRAPIPVESTPLGRINHLRESLGPFHPQGRHDSSIRKWNAGISRAYSPLPPSSPPPPSPPSQPVASTSQQQLPQRYRFSSDEPDENQGPVYESREHGDLSDGDLFGLLATERKLKSLRQRRPAAPESSRAPGASRAPLGSLALDEVLSSEAIPVPDRIPTPMPSDDSHNIDDLYLDVDPVRPGLSHADDSDGLEDEDKENVPTADYDLNEDKENYRPPLARTTRVEAGRVPSRGYVRDMSVYIDRNIFRAQNLSGVW